MFAIIENGTNRVASVVEDLRYVRTQENGMTSATESEKAMAVYTAKDDAFWPLRDRYPGDKTYRVVTVSEVPDGVDVSALKYQDGALIENPEPPVPTVQDAMLDMLADLDYRVSQQELAAIAAQNN